MPARCASRHLSFLGCSHGAVVSFSRWVPSVACYLRRCWLPTAVARPSSSSGRRRWGAEVAEQGVSVELVQSYLVTSAMSKVRRATALIPGPHDFVRSVLASIGRSGGAQGLCLHKYAILESCSTAVVRWGHRGFHGPWSYWVEHEHARGDSCQGSEEAGKREEEGLVKPRESEHMAAPRDGDESSQTVTCRL